MNCREKCGACCIVTSISSPIPGMPEGKPAGAKCIHLTENYRCQIYFSPGKPKVCDGFQAEVLICGNSREEAIKNLADLEGIDYNNIL